MNVYRNPNTYKKFLTMAIVHKYTILYFTLIIHESMSSSINRDLCLETVKRFIDYEVECNFGLSNAEDLLQDVTTCPKKCNLQTSHLHDKENVLGKIYLTIGDKREINFCSGSSNFNINCSSWIASEYIIWDGANSCFLKDAQCVHLKNYCVCHCLSGYILVEEKCLKKVLEFGDSCEFTEQCIQPFSVCSQGKCKCLRGYAAFEKESCLRDNVPVGGFCSLNKQCTGSNNSGICKNGRCTCAEGFKFVEFECKKRNLEFNDSCEITEQCKQPISVCFRGKCKCIKGYSAFDTDSCIKDTVPVGGFCILNKQCIGSNNSGICENGRCTCAKEFTFIDLVCKKSNDLPNSLGIESSISQQHDINIGMMLGALFGGFILGVVVTAVVTTLMYRRLLFQTRKREEPDVMFSDNRTCGGTSSIQILYRNNKKQKGAKLSRYSFAKETQGYNLSSKQEDERTEDVYNHLHEHTEQDDDTYDHACAVPIQSTDLSEYSNIHDAATFRPSPSKDGDDYSTLRK